MAVCLAVWMVAPKVELLVELWAVGKAVRLVAGSAAYWAEKMVVNLVGKSVASRVEAMVVRTVGKLVPNLAVYLAVCWVVQKFALLVDCRMRVYKRE